MRWPVFVMLLGALAAGCAASSGGMVSRSFERPEARDIPLESLDVVVVVSGPPVASPPQLSVPAFEPPTWSSVLRGGELDAETEVALVAALRARLQSEGFTTRFRFGSRGDDAGPLETAPAAATETSTAPTEAARPEIRPAPSPAPLPSSDVRLEPGVTLRTVLDDSTADGVLVIRVVPVDAFYLFDTDTEQLVNNAATIDGQPPPQERAELRSGRLLIGQAFLFDRRTGLRVWSRQLPDLPEDGRLNAKSGTLAYGILVPKGGREPMPAEKAGLAAARFARVMLEDLPGPQAGEPGAYGKLSKVDPSDEQARQAFLDESHFVIGVDAGWSLETAGLEVRLEEEDLDREGPDDELGVGAVAPNGVFRVTPRLGYQSPGGTKFLVGIPLGFAPSGGFSRTYFRDNPDPNMADPDDIGASVSLDSPMSAGVEVGLSYALLLTPTLSLEPNFGAFFELWDLGAGPVPVLEADQLYRGGVYGGLDVLLKPSEGSPLFFRGGLRGRLGGANAGPILVGGGLSLGFGLFL